MSAAFWDRLADGYAKRPFPDRAATDRKLEWTRAHLPRGGRLLDVGCGTGTLLLELAPHLGAGLGLDLSPRMISIAEGKAAAAAVTHVRFEARGADRLSELEGAGYDCVFLFNILHLVADPAALLSAAAGALAPGGLLVTSTPCLGGIWFPPYPVAITVLRWFGKAPAVTFFDLSAVRAHIERAGFTGLEAPDVGLAPPAHFLVARRPGATPA